MLLVRPRGTGAAGGWAAREAIMPRLLAQVLMVGALLFIAASALAAPPQNLDFEQEPRDGAIPGWFIPPVCEKAGWSGNVIEVNPAQGSLCLEMMLNRPEGSPAGGTAFGNIMQVFDATPYRGKRIVVNFRARLGEKATARAQPWVRVDRASDKMGFFDNCADRPVTDREWKKVTIAGNVDDDAASINIGLMVMGGDGPAYLDDVSVTSMEKPAVRADGPRELMPRGLANLEATTRAIGYVRHYYPSDEAAAVDWDRFTVDAILAAEPAENPTELAETLARTFAPIAPAMRFSASDVGGAFDPKSMLTEGGKPTHTIVWKHRGFAPGAPKAGAIYTSERIERPIADPPDENLPEIGDAVIRGWTLLPSETLHVRMPIVLYKDAQGTLPRPVSSYAPAANAPELSVDDRATRLAGVVLAWNVLEHHYPYFDVIKDDWNAALREALRSAATDTGDAQYLLTLQKLTAHLHDGHGYVGSRMQQAGFALPLALTFVGEEVVVENAAGAAVPQGILPGDVVLSIGGKPIAEIVSFARAHEPAATDGFFKSRAACRIAQCDTSDPVQVVLRSPEGMEKVAKLKPVAPSPFSLGRSGPIVSEPRAGIWYVDLDRANDKDLDAVMSKLATAKGVVFDMRGYPNHFSMGLLGHLSDKRLLCARWEIPIANRPDRDEMMWDHARWDLPPIQPRLTGKVAFITDGRAISAAETFLGIVEHYKLAEIVGEPTAGTNGNVNVIKLPAGYTISFTGMKVLKHDGSQHHGIGISPTVLVHRTIAGIAAGKDELMEKAIEVVDQK